MHRPFFLMALFFCIALPLQAVASAVPASAPAALAGSSEKPVHLPPVSGTNNSKIPTEIQVTVPGQPGYTTTIQPARSKAATAAASATAACSRMKAPYRSGLWEITSVSSNSLMQQPISAKIKRCVTERDAQNACGLNQLSGGRNRDCQISDMQVSGNTATWAMTCDSPHFTGQGSGKSTFTADAYQGTFDMQASMQGTRMQMNTTFTGKRLGNCK